MAALGFWDAFNQGLEVGNKIHAASTQRNMDQELAGVMDPEQQAAVYSKYGQADKANQLKTLAQQNKLMGLQVDAATREADKAKRLGALDEEYQTLSSGLLKGTEAVKSAMAAGQMTPEQGAAALQQFYNHHIPNGFDLHIENGQLVHDDPRNPGKRVAVPISGRTVLSAFDDLPVMLQGEFERRKNALIGDYGATRRAAQENAKFGLELRGANRADRALDFQISDADRNYNQRGAFHADDVRLKERELGDNRAYRSGALNLQRAELNAKIPLISAQAGSLQASAAGQRLANIGLQGEGGIGTKAGTGQSRGGAVQVRPQDMIKFNEDANNAVMSHPNYKQMTPSDIEYAKQEYLARTYPQYFSPRQQADYSSAAASAFGN